MKEEVAPATAAVCGSLSNGDATQQVHTATDLKMGQAVLLGGLVRTEVTNKEKEEMDDLRRELRSPRPAAADRDE